MKQEVEELKAIVSMLAIPSLLSTNLPSPHRKASDILAK